MGSAACYHFARRGLSVLGIEQFEVGHERGSSHGRSRVIRKAYFEDPRYVPLLHECYKLWGELEAATGETLMHQTGCLNFGPTEHECVRGVCESAERHGLSHEILSAEEICRRWPVFEPNDGDVGLYETDGGMLLPEKCITAHMRLAERHGCRILQNTRVAHWTATPRGAIVETTAGRFECRHLVITAGAWLPVIAAQLGLPLTIERQVQAWFEAKEPGPFALGRMPVFIHFLRSQLLRPAARRRWGGQGRTAPWRADYHGRRRDRTVRGKMRRTFGRTARHLPGPMDGCSMPRSVSIPIRPTRTSSSIAIGPRGNSFWRGASGPRVQVFVPRGRILSELVIDGNTPSPIGLFSIARFRG